ncbi:helix-turn-helix domain-containing protein [Celeribacter naphthalenivorans]|uniref:helix-turn-helix domain-containing protein n=1 Tax=Celeribacter naphthalenivorans TaxID=1614694 RepID=UPI001CFBE381|nr:helix-turn-helix domain-containing protein [Celeribacter naphthalenivorans]
MTLHLLPTQADRAWQRRTAINTASAIATRVAEKYGITLGDLRGPERTRNIAHPRQEAMAAIRAARPDMSLPQIGRFFNRDHTTVIHGIRAVEKRAAQ